MDEFKCTSCNQGFPEKKGFLKHVRETHAK